MNKEMEMRIGYDDDGLVVSLSNDKVNVMMGVLLAVVASNVVEKLIDKGSRGMQLISEARSLASTLKTMKFVVANKNVSQPFNTEACTIDILEKLLAGEAIMQIREGVSIERTVDMLEQLAARAA